MKAAEEVIAGKLDENFPLYVWQTGSGTQSNMNVNEVISNRSIQMATERSARKDPVHPNDHVNLSQSSNDTFPTAMHIATVKEIKRGSPAKVKALAIAMENKEKEWQHIVKIGRTHLEDAVPLTVGQEWSGYVTQVRYALARMEHTLGGLYQLACGGTAVGTGLNSAPDFDVAIAKQIAELTNEPFVRRQTSSKHKGGWTAWSLLTPHCAVLAVALMKIANDMRWLAPGPVAGLAN